MFKFLLPIALIAPVVLAQPISIGVRGGVPFTGGFKNFTEPGIAFVQIDSTSKLYIVGPMVELHLPLGLSVEADALYHPIQQTVTVGNIVSSSENIALWEFPVLAKYHFPFPVIKPLIEAGPSFRHVRFDYFSNAGFTFGAGVEIKLGHLRIEPEIRYTRWGGDAAPGRGVGFNSPSQLNQAAFLVGLTF